MNAASDSLLNALAGRKITLDGVAHSALMGCGMALMFFGLGKLLGPAIRLLRGVPKLSTPAEIPADVPASTPVGSSRSPLNVGSQGKPPINRPSTINGLDYSGHALDRMQGRGIFPS